MVKIRAEKAAKILGHGALSCAPKAVEEKGPFLFNEI